MALVQILVTLIIVFVLLGLARWALQKWPLGEPLTQLANYALVAIGVIALAWALLAAVGMAPAPHFGGSL
jgi:hypothetical protein